MNSTIDIILIFSNTIFIRLLHSFQSPLFSLFTVSNHKNLTLFTSTYLACLIFYSVFFIAALFFEEQTASNSCYVEYNESIFVCVWIRMRPETQAKFYLNWVNSRFVTTKTKNCHLISQEATQKNLIKMHKRTNSEDKNDIHILYLYWLKPLLKVVRARAWAPFITADGVFVLSRCTATVNNWF